jgi:hypothetical protein
VVNDTGEGVQELQWESVALKETSLFMALTPTVKTEELFVSPLPTIGSLTAVSCLLFSMS